MLQSFALYGIATPVPASKGVSAGGVSDGAAESDSTGSVSEDVDSEPGEQQYTFQLGSLSEEKDARKLLRQLQDAGYSG